MSQNNNDNTGNDKPEAEVVDFVERTKARLEAEDKAPKSGRVFTPENTFEVEEPEEVEVGTFKVVLHSGDTFDVDGFLVATNAFVGFADASGVMQAVIPMGNLKYVRPADPV